MIWESEAWSVEIVREFAEKVSIRRRRRAHPSWIRPKSTAAVSGPITDIAKQALAITEANLKASFD
jgi:hypothetical protein